jgi:aldose 1-epimerase
MPSQVVEIVDGNCGSSAQILVSKGFNCFSWQPMLGDGPRQMLWAEPGFASGTEQPLYSGIPLLFPFPGRIGGTKFEFEGHEYHLDPGDEYGNALHGFVYTRPWQIAEQSTNRVTGIFQASINDDKLLAQWPSDFRIAVTYEVRDCQLLCDVCYQNVGDRRMPCAFGTHPYFRLPLSTNSDPEKTRILVPATEVWEEENMLMTGRALPAIGDADLKGGNALAGRVFDTGYTNLRFDSDGKTRIQLIDPTNGRTLTQFFDRSFTHCIVYTPPHREAICLEPWTGLADAPWRDSAGRPPGLQTLGPQEVFETTIRIDLSE